VAFLSLFGIIIGVAIFVVFTTKGFHLVFSSLVTAVIVCAFSWLNPLTMITDTYMTSMANMFKNYLPMFILGCVFGKCMCDTGVVRTIALSVAKLAKSSKNPKFWALLFLPGMYCLLTFSGVSGFIIVFTLLAISNELFKECDVPWDFYVYGTSGCIPASILPGSLYVTNVILAKGFDTTLTAAPFVAILCFVIIWVMIGVLAYFDIRSYTKRGEGYLPSGAAFDANPSIGMTGSESEPVPTLICSWISLLAPIISIILKLNVLIALLMGCIVCLALNFKHVKDLKSTIGNGLTVAVSSLANVCAMTGLIALMMVSSGFQMIIGALDMLPPLYSVLSLGVLSSAIVGSLSSWIPAAIPDLVARFTAAGISMPVAHRMTILSTLSYAVPTNAGCVNTVGLTRLNPARAFARYFKTNAIPSLTAIIVCIILLKLGVIA